MSIQRAQFEIPSTEFLDWIAYLDDDINNFHREDFYLAQIAAEIRRSYVNNPEKVKLKTFIMKFGVKEKPKKLSIEEITRRSKRFWNSLVFGVKK